MRVFRPLVQAGAPRPPGAVPLAGGPLWFTHAEDMRRAQPPVLVPARDLPEDVLERLCAARPPMAGMRFDRPRLMGILNVTPDSFSDGGAHHDPSDALRAARAMSQAGADILDIGGESTRPGARATDAAEEIRRIRPVVASVCAGLDTPVSIDTRKAGVADVAIEAGAVLVNDVSAFRFDPALAPLCAARAVPVCVMHALGAPETMQRAPRYDDVVLDVYAFLAARVAALGDLGIPRHRIIVDPGIGFGKTVEHNLALLRNIAVFHGLGCPILLGVSRKGVIGTVADVPNAADRAPGSIAVGLAALAQGVQILRVHDVAATAQAMRLWQAVRE